MKKIKLLSLLTIVCFTSCSKVLPSGFWLKYNSNLIKEKNINQGPWGGHTEIHWNSTGGLFIPKDIISYAKDNGWKLIDSIKYPSDSITDSNYSISILEEKVLPRIKDKNYTVFRFKTGWVAVEPGNARETEINGFAVLNSSKTKLIVYQLWGE